MAKASMTQTTDIVKMSPDFVNAKDKMLFVAKKYFHLEYLFPWQRLVIANILDARRDIKNKTGERQTGLNQIVLFPTGAGKSACFLVPAFLLEGVTLVIFPLLALIKDQEQKIKDLGLECATFIGDMTQEQENQNWHKLKNGAKLVFTTPEYAAQSCFRQKLKKYNVEHIVIDEAHCTVLWGQSFRPCYLAIGKIIKLFGAKIISAFSATASPPVLKRMSKILFFGDAYIIQSSLDRPNINYSVLHTASKRKIAIELALSLPRPMLIFCGTRLASYEMANTLYELVGSKVKFYHAGLKKKDRQQVQNWFLKSTDGILCCTCAFGMGVDKKDIRTVIHIQMPDNVENYIQEAGRGGRDKKPCYAVLVLDSFDKKRIGRLTAQDENFFLKDYASGKMCRRCVLLKALNCPPVACFGCDVCNKTVIKYRCDMDFVKDFVARNKKLYTQNNLIEHLIERANNLTTSFTKKAIWEHKDFSLALQALKAQKEIFDAGGLFRHRLSSNYKAKHFFRAKDVKKEQTKMLLPSVFCRD